MGLRFTRCERHAEGFRLALRSLLRPTRWSEEQVSRPRDQATDHTEATEEGFGDPAPPVAAVRRVKSTAQQLESSTYFALNASLADQRQWPKSRRSLTGATHWPSSPAGATGQPQFSSTSGTRRSSPDARYKRRIFGQH